MVKISVIVPVYNAEKYLEECLDSVINQTLSDIEIICINDGSTDSSLSILEEYQKRDSRIRIFSQENRGAGASRNFAITQAKGEYVYFIDSDDYLELNALEDIYSIAKEKSVDFLMFKISNFNEDTNETIDDDYYSMPYLKETVGENTFNYEDITKMALDLCVCPPGNLFERQFISDIRFPEGLLFEDNVFFTHALFKADKIYFHDRFLYHRRKHLDSTTTPITIRSLDTIEITNLIMDLTEEFHHADNHKKELYYRIFNNIYAIFKKADKKDKPEFFERIKKEYLKNRDRWENDEYFTNDLNPYYKHIFNCAISSRNWREFERSVDNYNRSSNLRDKFNKFRKKIL